MLRRRFVSNALLVVLIGVFAVLGAQNASADGDRRVLLRFAGIFIQNLEQTDVDVTGTPMGTSTLGLIQGQVKGNLGRADLTAVTKASSVVMPVADERGPDGFLKVADITDNNLVFTFADLSLLYGDGQGVACVNFATGEQYAAVDGIWLGGTARFRDASGEFSIRIDEFAPVSPATQVVAETGTITGTLSRGH